MIAERSRLEEARTQSIPFPFRFRRGFERVSRESYP